MRRSGRALSSERSFSDVQRSLYHSQEGNKQNSAEHLVTNSEVVDTAAPVDAVTLVVLAAGGGP